MVSWELGIDRPRCTAVGSQLAGGSSPVVALREQSPVPLAGWPGALASFTLKKLECSKQAEAGLNNGAWNNRIGSRFYFVGFRNPR